MTDKVVFDVIPVPNTQALDGLKKQVESVLEVAAIEAFTKGVKEAEKTRQANLHAETARMAKQTETVSGASANVAGGVGRAFNIAGGLAGSIGHNPIAGASHALQGVLGMAGPWGQAASAGIGAVSAGIGGAISAVGQTPGGQAATFQLDMAMKDLVGTIGHSLTPVVQALVPWVRMVADVFAAILPNATQMQEAMAPLDEALEAIKDAIDPVIPYLRDLGGEFLKQVAEQFKLLVPLIELTAFQFKLWEPAISLLVKITQLQTEVLKKFGEAIKWVLSKMGIDTGQGVREATSRRKNLREGASHGAGGAARNVSYGGIGDYGKSMIASAFSMGTGQNYQERTAASSERMLTVMEQVKQILEQAKAPVGGFPQPG